MRLPCRIGPSDPRCEASKRDYIAAALRSVDLRAEALVIAITAQHLNLVQAPLSEVEVPGLQEYQILEAVEHSAGRAPLAHGLSPSGP
ncbi:MAG: hypothetical protein ABL889_14125 [Terricaulis sp.]